MGLLVIANAKFPIMFKERVKKLPKLYLNLFIYLLTTHIISYFIYWCLFPYVTIHSRDLYIQKGSSNKSYFRLGKYFKNNNNERKERFKPLRVENFHSP